MRFTTLLVNTLACSLAAGVAALSLSGKPGYVIRNAKRDPLQNIVTWDEHSIFVHGERVMLYSGEYHPFRLPVPSLWLDVFQKIKALGFNCVSFYVDWALLEGEPGHFRADGIFALEPFFDAATAAGVYLLARPGPYINAEVSGGGFPGWLQRVPGRPRTTDKSFINATNLYATSVARIIAKAQITNGGPIILVQPENEYSQAEPDVTSFPDGAYMSTVEEQLRFAGVVVPTILNDAYPHGYFSPYLNTPGEVDIYGHDGYPLGFDCGNPYTWPDNDLPTYYGDLHAEQAPTTPYSIVEFQGGSFDPWGGWGFNQCSQLLNSEFERVFYKNDYSFGVTILNLYMIFGGTNWGNLGHPGGYTSYDYGACITEERAVVREKYSEVKLQANFLMVSSAYLTATPGNNSNANGSFTDSPALAVTPLYGNGTNTNFFVLRHAAYNSLASTAYKLIVPTSVGLLTIPQLTGTLTLNGRDSKIHVTDYAVGQAYNLLYSTAEIFTWKTSSLGTVLVVYGGPGERHEMAVSGALATVIIEGPPPQIANVNGSTVLNWQTSSTRTVVQLGKDLYVYILDRNSAYDYWVLDLPAPVQKWPPYQWGHTWPGVQGGSPCATGPASSLVLKAGYLMRNASVSGNELFLTGDINATTSLEVISGAPANLKTLQFNGNPVSFQQDARGVMTAVLSYTAPSFQLPDLNTLQWTYIDSLPEIQSTYDDSRWTVAGLATTYNTYRNLSTPTSLYASDYGYNTGVLLFRGHFTASGSESVLRLQTQGGDAFGTSVWINGTFLGSWNGTAANSNYNSTFTLPSLVAGGAYVLTVVIDNMGLDENGAAGESGFKNPRGILNYSLAGHAQSDISWKLTGNLGGEQYLDLTRGPLNEGGLWAERQGYTLPGAPSAQWPARLPSAGIMSAGVGFFAANFTLDMPVGYDIPLTFNFPNMTAAGSTVSNFRLQLFVNGYQFGKYIHNIGPQTAFPVPQGILNYHGSNYIGLLLWAQDAAGAQVSNMSLTAAYVVQSGYGPVAMSPMSGYAVRPGAY